MSKIDSIGRAFSRSTSSGDPIFDALNMMRTHLGMEVAYLSEIRNDDIVFRAVDAPGLNGAVRVGMTRPLSDSYCNHVASGDLPELIGDTFDVPLARELNVTKEFGIRSHVGVPIERSDGSIYGMFCCLSTKPNPTLNSRDLSLMRVFARLAQVEVQNSLERSAHEVDIARQIEETMSARNYAIVYQPIIDLNTNEIASLEALCRFKSTPYRPPNLWFGDAARVGLGELLELAVISDALQILPQLPETVSLSLNAGPETAASGGLLAVLLNVPRERVTIEITEHSDVVDWAELNAQIKILRDDGVAVAVDDTGSGFSGLQHLIRMSPDYIKLDRALVSDIDKNSALRSLCAAMVHFASETNAVLVAEGIETQAEFDTLRDLGVHRGQGWHIGRPMASDEAIMLCQARAAQPRKADTWLGAGFTAASVATQ